MSQGFDNEFQLRLSVQDDQDHTLHNVTVLFTCFDVDRDDEATHAGMRQQVFQAVMVQETKDVVFYRKELDNDILHEMTDQDVAESYNRTVVNIDSLLKSIRLFLKKNSRRTVVDTVFETVTDLDGIETHTVAKAMVWVDASKAMPGQGSRKQAGGGGVATPAAAGGAKKQRKRNRLSWYADCDKAMFKYMPRQVDPASKENLFVLQSNEKQGEHVSLYRLLQETVIADVMSKHEVEARKVKTRLNRRLSDFNGWQRNGKYIKR